MGDTGIIAVDSRHKFDGHYWRLAFPANPMTQSAAAVGTLNLGQAGIVQGDTNPPHTDPNNRTTCIDVDGAFVKVAFDSLLNPSSADGFSVEAWVKPGWLKSDTGVVRVVIASFTTGGGSQGFSLYASEVNNWRAAVRTSTGPVTIDDGPDIQFDEASQGMTHHLVLTFGSGFLKLFVNGIQSNSKKVPDYQPSTNDLFIGCGAPQLEPVFPWFGKLQCVAVYKGALQASDVLSHFNNGMGSLT
jgi:Concanavalin A-like lectin/glucanases superfamily